MNTTCPACTKAVDPLRSRFVGVRDGKVVAFCSAECAAKGAAATPSRTATPVAGVPARTATPVSGVPARVDGGSGPPRPGTPPPGVPVSLESGPVIEIVRDPASRGVPVATPARADRTEPRAKHPDEIPMAAFWTADKEKSGAVRLPGDDGAPSAARDKSAPVVVAKDRTGPVAAAKDKSVAKDKSAAVAGKDKSAAVPAKDKSVAVPAKDKSAAVAGKDQSAAVAKDKSVPVAAVNDKSAPLKASPLPPRRVFAEPAPDFSISDLMPVRKSRAPIVIILLVLIAAGGYAFYYFQSASEPAEPKAAPAPPHAAVEPPPPAPVVPAEALVDQARTALGAASMATPRVARLAAEALARTGDPHALDLLGRQLGLKAQAGSAAAGAGSAAAGAGSAAAGAGSAAPVVETSDIARLDLAYALARGHDKRGSEALGAALGSQRAEVRDEAARLLALLGDARAVPHLTDLLAVPQRRLGAAEHLAHLAEPHALKALEQLRADPKASVDDKARATIALGIAGHADVAPALREMLGDAHFNAFAAAALAELKDSAARPVLVRQLESPALRVRAARALRHLDPALDPHPLVAPLLDVMRSGRDTDQVQAAEAVLLLCGPLAWSTFE